MSKQSKGSSAAAIHLYQFPQLRKAWQTDDAGQPLDSAEYQQQIMAGFQQGIDDGFNQGLEQGRQQGYQEGREEGLHAGREEGRRQAHAEFIQAAQPLDVLVTQMQQALDQHEQRRRSELLQLVEKVTRQVIRCELALQPTQLLALVEEALNSLTEPPQRLRVLLNPEEFARISKIDSEKVQAWGLTADAEMAEGECRIITDSTEMDVGCAHRLSQCMDALEQSLSPERDKAQP